MPVAVINRRVDQSVSIPTYQTLDATPIQVSMLSVPEGTTVHAVVYIIARATDGTSRSWHIERTGKNSGAGVVAVGAAPAVVGESDAGAAAWSVALSVVGSDVMLNLTGDAAKTVWWTVVNDYLLLSTNA